MKIIELIFILLIFSLSFQFASATTLQELNDFLINDTTNEHRVFNNQIPFYTCGHFTFDLMKNASLEGIEMYPTFLYSRYGCNHIIASIEINETLFFIEPMNDGICLEKHIRRAYRGYKIGTSVTHSSFSRLNRVHGFIEMKMWN